MVKMYVLVNTHEYYHWISSQLISNTHLLIYFNEATDEYYIFCGEGKMIPQITSDF